MSAPESSRKQRVLVVDADVNLRSNLADYLAMQEDMLVVGAVGDGAEALDAAIRNRPDVIVIDSMLPLIDGLGLLRHLNESRADADAVCIFLVNDGQDAVLREIISRGVDYCMVKPVNLFDLAHQIRAAAGGARAANTYRKIAARVLRDMQMRVQDDGFEYAERAVAILLSRQGRGMRYKSVYIMVEEETAGICSDSGKYVENDIRNAIRRAHAVRAPFYCAVLGLDPAQDVKCPTNGIFLSSVVQYIRVNHNLP